MLAKRLNELVFEFLYFFLKRIPVSAGIFLFLPHANECIRNKKGLVSKTPWSIFTSKNAPEESDTRNLRNGIIESKKQQCFVVGLSRKQRIKCIID
jgi:hypothetical protein